MTILLRINWGFRHLRWLSAGLRTTLFLCVTVLTACDHGYSIAVQDRQAATSANCTTYLQTTQAKMKFIFMVDNSQSTLNTDRNRYFRVQVFENFLTQYSGKTNFSYAFGHFDTTTVFFDRLSRGFSTTIGSPFGNASDLTAALDLYGTQASGGFTYYDIALTKIDNVIRTLSGPNPDHATIMVLFLSDGQPNDIGWEDIDINWLLASRIRGLRTLAASYGSLLSLSTLYFGPQGDSVAVDHLQVMAREGNGRFLDSNLDGGTHYAVSDAVTVPGVNCTSE